MENNKSMIKQIQKSR